MQVHLQQALTPALAWKIEGYLKLLHRNQMRNHHGLSMQAMQDVGDLRSTGCLRPLNGRRPFKGHEQGAGR
jgi:hypothetical protein